MAYIALKRMVVARTNGEHVTVQRGEELPKDARLGRNVALWIRRGWMTDQDGNIRDERHWGAMSPKPLENLKPPEPAMPPPREPDPPPIDNMKKGELIELAESMGLDTDGTKAELIERIDNAQVE